MSDQASILRGLVEQKLGHADDAPARRAEPRARTIAVTSGKGGVGKSHIALNLSIALAGMQQKVCLLDGNLGLGSIDILCGLNGYWNLSHVVTGARLLSEVVLQGPMGIHVVPGASGIVELADCPDQVQREILGQLDQLENEHDFVVLDTGSGIHHVVRRFLAAADVVLVMTTPEPTSITDAYATIKSLAAVPDLEIEILVNQVRSAQEARAIIERIQVTSRNFLGREVASAGFVPLDPAVPRSVLTRRPFGLYDQHAPASRAVSQLARRMKNLAVARRPRGPFFAAVRERFAKKAA